MSEAKAGERFEMLGGNIQGEFVEVRTMDRVSSLNHVGSINGWLSGEDERNVLLGEALLAGRDEVAVAELEARVALLDGRVGDRAEPRRHHAEDEAETRAQLGRRHDETGLEGAFHLPPSWSWHSALPAEWH